jgi:hypothetical protein
VIKKSVYGEINLQEKMMEENLLNYLKMEGKAPVDYVLSRFEQFDIVLLGEMHRVKQQVELYHKLIPGLAEMGQDIKPVTPIPDFLNESNISVFRDYAPYNEAFDKSIDEINTFIKEDAASLSTITGAFIQ